jgi:hypothetical protein
LCVVSALLVAAALASESPDSIVPEHDLRDAVGGTVRYLLRDTTSKAAEQLHSHELDFQVKHAHHRGEGIVETFGKHSHRSKFLKMGFELLEAEDGDGGFQKTSKAKGYHNPKQLHEAFVGLTKQFPKQAKLIDLTAEYTMPKTIQGNSIYALHISEDLADDTPKPKLLVVHNHHARELNTPELALHSSKQLLGQEGKKILKNNQVYVIWTLNPDGLNLVWTKNTWHRTNARNVDLNRNYPIGWKASCAGTSSGGECFRGSKPFSEVETQTMRAFQQHMNFAKVMDFHSYSEEVRTNYGPCSALPTKLDEFFQSLRDGIAHKMHYQASRSCCMGGDIHYAYNRHGSLAYLVEMGTSFQPRPDVMEASLRQVWPGLKDFLEISIPVVGKVHDKAGNPVVAHLELPEFQFSMNEKFHSGNDGHYHLWLPAGKHKVLVQAKGKPIKLVIVEVTQGATTSHNINVDNSEDPNAVQPLAAK